MATGATTMVYTTQWTAVHRVKVGDRIEHDGRIYQVFRWLRLVRPHKPLGAVAIAIECDARGAPQEESVALVFNDTNELVYRVAAEVRRV